MKPVQYFSKEYLQNAKKMKPEQILRFLEDFRILSGVRQRAKSRLISIKVPENLLAAFRLLCAEKGMPYQTQIKKLMEAWIKE